ncbi:MAG: glycosyltransferase family 9 protein [Candidatus Nitrospinota bacterium M3_3B_026]
MGENILILNLTRIGDLIQTTPLIKGLREKHPSARITVLANVKFAGILELVEGVDEILIFDIQQFASKDGAEPDVLAIYEYLDGITRRLAGRRFDLVINLSHSKLSAMMARLIEARDAAGFIASPTGDRLVKNPWLIYFMSMLNFRMLNRFNLVDMYLRTGGAAPGSGARLGLSAGEEEMARIGRESAALGVGPDEPLVAVQAGASRSDRRWSPKNFAEAADRLSRARGAKTVLLGAPAEAELGAQVEAAMETPAINLVGKTSLAQLAAWVRRADLLITNDTGTMHVAAALGTPIVALFFAHARVEETGPYAEGAYILSADIECAPCSHRTKCEHLSCLGRITPEDVAEAGMAAMDGAKLPERPERGAGVRIYRSAFGADGGVEYVPFGLPELSRDEFFAYLYRPLFVEALARWNDPEAARLPAVEVDDAIGRLKARFAPPARGAVEAWTARAVEGAERLMALGAEAARLSTLAGKKGNNAGLLRELARAIEGVEDEIAAAASVYEAAGPLAFIYRRRQESLEGEEPGRIAREAALAGSWLEMAAGMFAEAARRAESALTDDRTALVGR